MVNHIPSTDNQLNHSSSIASHEFAIVTIANLSHCRGENIYSGFDGKFGLFGGLLVGEEGGRGMG